MGDWSDDRDRPQARVIADSVAYPTGKRLTTLEVTMARFVLAEFNTHRVFSRNSESSRAVPTAKRIERVRTSPMIPMMKYKQAGMSGSDEVPDDMWVSNMQDWWIEAAETAARSSDLLDEMGLHKSVVNRLMEPFLWHTVVVTSTEWEGFFQQRCHEAAQPEIRVVAEAMRDAMFESEPEEMAFPSSWHLPFIEPRDWVIRPDDDDREDLISSLTLYGKTVSMAREDADIHLPVPAMCRISAARCARTSYLTHDGRRSRSADLTLFDRLVVREPGSDDPIHWSPLEHVARPCTCPDGKIHPGNFVGWDQLRHIYGSRSPYTQRNAT